ncbi:MAG: sodium:proton antiporter [Fidelibacterota bacterium]
MIKKPTLFRFGKGIIFIVLIYPRLLLAGSETGSLHLEGSSLSIFWVIPFIGILLSIGVFPLLAPHFWHQHFGKVSLFWAVSFIIPFLIKTSWQLTLYQLLHVFLLEYLPFIILLLALFTISGGVQLTGSLVGTPIVNTIIILVGTILASWMGTTGAAMLLIRPLIRANLKRKHKVHIIVFFIFLVANIGGSLTPLGDPPLFLGFLKGVDFFWTTKSMFLPMLFMVGILLSMFFILDSFYYRHEASPLETEKPIEKVRLKILGKRNLILLVGVMASVLVSGFWHSQILVFIYHVELDLQDITRDILLIVLTYISWKITPQKIREGNSYTWFPIVEVAKLFGGIFVTILPVIAILRAGTQGALAVVINSVSDGGNPLNFMYFWATGILSSFLDNAPTYLVFFNTAGGDPTVLMNELHYTLVAISTGAVFMGANTYIGNAPNFMVKSISESAGIEMPSFFGYLLKWSLPILVPLYIVMSLLFF